MSVSFSVPRAGCKHKNFLESQSGLGLQLHSAYQEILLGSHEEDEARACLILPQHILQPLPGMHRGQTSDLHLARRNRDGTLTYTDLVGCWCRSQGASVGPEGAENMKAPVWEN